MTNAFKTRTPKLTQQEPIEKVEKVQQDEVQAGKQEKRKRALSGGRDNTLIAGIREALKQRLGQ